MKNLSTLGLVVWFFLVPAGCAHAPDIPGSMPEHQETATAQTNGTPAVEVSETAFDFGEVTEGNDYVHAFKIRNTGTGVLVIKKIIPG
ncbi:MAG: DUF1573 domain-containing protein [Syntrophobacteraceae bacterium]|jgi:hypothetical protein